MRASSCTLSIFNVIHIRQTRQIVSRNIPIFSSHFFICTWIYVCLFVHVRAARNECPFVEWNHSHRWNTWKAPNCLFKWFDPMKPTSYHIHFIIIDLFATFVVMTLDLGWIFTSFDATQSVDMNEIKKIINRWMAWILLAILYAMQGYSKWWTFLNVGANNFQIFGTFSMYIKSSNGDAP